MPESREPYRLNRPLRDDAAYEDNLRGTHAGTAEAMNVRDVKPGTMQHWTKNDTTKINARRRQGWVVATPSNTTTTPMSAEMAPPDTLSGPRLDQPVPLDTGGHLYADVVLMEIDERDYAEFDRARTARAASQRGDPASEWVSGERAETLQEMYSREILFKAPEHGITRTDGRDPTRS